ncbi:MAG: hypothetical protein JXB88_07110 [Spirochaetales bacterium]|nr:hypothetical protein [Spirochaetales bacterium]
MKECTKCLNTINENESLCTECRNFNQTKNDWEQKEKEFTELINQYKKPGSKYDVIVPLTGGKDSCYVLYYMAKILKVKVLAFTWDNGLIRQTAWRNMENAVKATGSGHVICKWDMNKTQRLLKAFFKRNAKVCYCPGLMSIGVFPLAIKENIPLIITGFSEGQRELNHNFIMPDQGIQKENFLKFCRLWNEFFINALKEFEPEYMDDIINTILGDLLYYTKPDVTVSFYPVMVPMSNYISWLNLDNLHDTLEKEIGWENASNSNIHSSCIIEPIKGYLEFRRELSELRTEINQMIRSGFITREQGKKEIRILGMKNTIPKNLKEFCEFINISEAEFHHYVALKRNVPEQALKFRQDVVNTISWIMGIEKHNTKFV